MDKISKISIKCLLFKVIISMELLKMFKSAYFIYYIIVYTVIDIVKSADYIGSAYVSITTF